LADSLLVAQVKVWKSKEIPTAMGIRPMKFVAALSSTGAAA